MNARRDSSSEPPRGSFGGRLLLTAAVLFALAATGALILTDEQRWLRLGIVAALWAALAGAFVAARYRRQVADQEEVLAERHERYQLELEREIAARREYELEVAAEARRQADEEARDDIAALRQELFGLRQTLEGLLGGEFLVERYALRAESTRMRSLPDDRELKRLPPAASVGQDAQTDLIDAVDGSDRSARRKVEPLPRRADRPAGRTQVPRPGKPPVVDARPEPRQHGHPAELSDRWFVPDGLGTDQPPRPARGNRHSTVASGYVEPVSGPRADANGFGPGTSGQLSPADPSGFGSTAGRAGRPEPATGSTAGRAESPGHGSSVGRNGSVGYGAGPAESSGFGPPAGRQGSSDLGPAGSRAGPSGHGWHGSPGYGSATRAESSGFGPPVGQNGTSGYGSVTRAEVSGYGSAVGRNGSSGYGPAVGRNGPAGPAESSGYGPAVGRNAPPGYGPAGAAESSAYGPAVGRAEASGYGPAVGRAQPPAPQQPPDPGGGRRRRAEGQPTWQETRDTQSRAEPEPSGSHAAGRSVSELLASHGGTARPATPRRRRRKD